MQVVTVSLFQFAGAADKIWAFTQMGLAPRAFAGMPELQFFKLMGTGAGAGFSTKPDFSTYSLLCVWPDRQTADDGLTQSKRVAAYTKRSAATATLFLEPTQCSGQWAAQEPLKEFARPAGPIVALTRAQLRLSKMREFWSLVPEISDDADGSDAQCFMMGMGEVPYRNQVTFSIWDDEDAMITFSRNSATHGEAVRRAYQESWFAECMFARFNLVDIVGNWPALDKVHAAREIMAISTRKQKAVA